MKRLILTFCGITLWCFNAQADFQGEGDSKGSVSAISQTEIDKVLTSDLRKRLTEPAPSAFSQDDLEFWKKRAKTAFTNASRLISKGDPNVAYDVIIQIGHYPRKVGKTGGEGKYVSEQEIASLVATGISQKLALLKTSDKGKPKTSRPIKFIVLPADDYNSNLKSELFIALHTDSADKACAVSASVGYEGDSDATGMHGIALALALTLGLDAEKFMQDNYTKDLNNYYAFKTVTTKRFKGVLEMSELSCPAQEEKLLPRAGVLAENLALAIQFALR